MNLRNDIQHYQEGFFIFDIPTFNESVVREAILNAVSHRNYQLAGSVFIRQFPDRLVIESPGGLPMAFLLTTSWIDKSPATAESQRSWLYAVWWNGPVRV